MSYDDRWCRGDSFIIILIFHMLITIVVRDGKQSANVECVPTSIFTYHQTHKQHHFPLSYSLPSNNNTITIFTIIPILSLRVSHTLLFSSSIHSLLPYISNSNSQFISFILSPSLSRYQQAQHSNQTNTIKTSNTKLFRFIISYYRSCRLWMGWGGK